METFSLQVSVAEGATSLPALTLHLPEVTLYVRLPLERLVTIFVSVVREDFFTDVYFWLIPAVTVYRNATDVWPEGVFATIEKL